MRLVDFVRPELVFSGLQVDSNEELFYILVDKAVGQFPALDKQTCFDLLMERENKFSTGLECGTAVPHAVVPGLESTICLVATLSEPLDFKSIDGSLTRVVFMLLSPPAAIATHIRILARIARFCSMPKFLERLLSSEGNQSLYQVIMEEDQRHV